ncbi:type VI secretion system tip protein TssI/VgrG [Pseudomonas eucalypticola]|uniref:Type VI secretion system tip protein VgrG n=1 Tax=Pseudomonas eucalypticola TaxID=2599595 RepID=A0A7D5D537_9PSED|nr:type VI secretion system tip protein TssI/VgrG [Pseudomonas eucalypticola]QKZ02401.1 type VI secretion system tip protein VgrG [Pseudomonas eucalypticola]
MSMDLSALFTAQNQRLFKITLPLKGGQELLLESFGGYEALSGDFAFELQLISESADVELKTAIGQPTLIEIELSTGGSRYIHGHIISFANKGSDGGMCQYNATLGSWLNMLAQRFDSQIFQDQTIIQVVTSIFSRYEGLAKFEFRVSRALKQQSYITQYRENDRNFVLRLLESEGLFYYFEHTADGHTMIIMDDSTVLTPLPEQPQIRFHSASVTETADSITDWTAQRTLQSGRFSAQTFDYRQPRNRLPVSMASLNNQGDVDQFEIYDYMGHYTHGDSDQGEILARNRIEAIELQGKTFAGESNCRALRLGYTFELTQHFDHDNGSAEDRQFLPMYIRHGGSNNYLSGGQAGYGNRFTCVRSKIKFRPTNSAAKPTISGPQTAIIVGPPGEEIYTDELGRVKVQFHWDRLGEFNHKSSCWVRVAQSGASGGFGSILIPRVGDEVVVAFLDGDPDRPLIMGSVYNSQNTPPWALPANKTQSGFLTRSLKGDGGTANFFRFEDKQGAEQVIVHAERNMDTEIEVDETHAVGNNRAITVGGTHTETITGNTQISVQEGAFSLTVNEQSITISAQTAIVLQVQGSSITLMPGKIEISSDLIVTKSTGATQITGAPVQINEEG